MSGLVAMTFAAERGIYTAHWGPPFDASIEVDGVHQERWGAVSGEVTVRTHVPGQERRVHQARVALSSTRDRADLARHLSTRGTHVNRDAWSELIEQAFVQTLRAHRAGEPAILMRDAIQPMDTGYAFSPLAHSTLPSTIFADGGSAKSWIALTVAASLQGGRSFVDGMPDPKQRNVAYMDWEMTGWEHRERLHQLSGIDMPPVLYVPCAQPLRDSVDRLRRIARDHGITYWIVDSVAPACGGEPESAEIAASYFNALRILGGGSLSLAHTRKEGPGSDQRAFGSTFWHNLTRLSWYAKGIDNGDGSMSVGLFCRKNNLGPLHPPMALVLRFGDGNVSVARADVADNAVLAEKLPIWRRVSSVLKGGPLTIHEIAEETSASTEAIRLSLKRGVGKVFANRTGPDGIERWALRTNREEAS